MSSTVIKCGGCLHLFDIPGTVQEGEHWHVRCPHCDQRYVLALDTKQGRNGTYRGVVIEEGEAEIEIPGDQGYVIVPSRSRNGSAPKEETEAE